jgi:hypothetical protein
LVGSVPVVTFYLIRDWHRMIDADSCAPLPARFPYAGLPARSMRRSADFARQLGVCLVLGRFYAID